jgi:hypothetical protein
MVWAEVSSLFARNVTFFLAAAVALLFGFGACFLRNPSELNVGSDKTALAIDEMVFTGELFAGLKSGAAFSASIVAADIGDATRCSGPS